MLMNDPLQVAKLTKIVNKIDANLTFNCNEFAIKRKTNSADTQSANKRLSIVLNKIDTFDNVQTIVNGEGEHKISSNIMNNNINNINNGLMHQQSITSFTMHQDNINDNNNTNYLHNMNNNNLNNGLMKQQNITSFVNRSNNPLSSVNNSNNNNRGGHMSYSSSNHSCNSYNNYMNTHQNTITDTDIQQSTNSYVSSYDNVVGYQTYIDQQQQIQQYNEYLYQRWYNIRNWSIINRRDGINFKLKQQQNNSTILTIINQMTLENMSNNKTRIFHATNNNI